MLIRIWLFGITFAFVSCDLTGEHICEVEESYPVNITEFSLRNVTVRHYKWCMGFPPRCSFYTLKTVKVPEVVEKLETRLLRKCCPGFAENGNGDRCVPCKKCFEGTCGNEGNCLCNSGFRGDDCADACEPLRWGVNCQYECLCEHGACNPRTGRCDCPTGWFGTRCEVPCLEGFYGKHCINRCNCGERDLCSPETGECSKKPSRQQEHQSTRAIHYMTEDILNLTTALNKQKSTPSLKKYYTFDMELDKNITGEKNDVIPRKNMNSQKAATTSPNRYWPKINNTTVSLENNDNYKKHYSITLKTMEDSAESTTEMSAEIGPKIETVAIIDENGSLEKTEKKEQSREIVYENIDTTDKKNEETKEPNVKTIQEAKLDDNIIKIPENRVNKIDVSGDQRPSQVSSTSRSPKNLEPSNTKTTTDEYLPIIRNNYKSSENHQGIIDSAEFSSKNPVSYVLPEAKTAMKNANKDAASSVEKMPKGDKTTGVTMHRLDDIISPTPIEPQAVTTPSTKEVEILNHTGIIEENELQNLEIMNVLTSRETSTQAGTISSTTEAITILKKGILPFDDVIPSTKSIDENFRNDLHTPEATENHILMKEAYERRDENVQIGEGASGEFDYSTNKNDIATHMSMVALISFILVLILSGIILVHQYTLRKRKKNTGLKIDGQSFPGGHTVSVYTHSIFHTPLPDPPIFENPVFNTPSGISTDQRTFQTHVVCSLNIPENKMTDEKEYTYDHPPSTGSYRAASIPEPPEVLETLTSEPLYDEIPSNRRGNQPLSPPPSYKSSCLYMNTCGKTRF